MKDMRLMRWILVACLVALPASAFARGRGGWHGSSHSSGSRGGWHVGYGGFRPFHGGHWGWAPYWGVHTAFGYPGYVWPYGVPWVIYPGVVPGYVGAMPEAIAIQPPSPAVVLHAGEVTGMNVGLRFQMQCDNPNTLVPTLESAGEANLALVLRGAAPGEANCRVSDGETPPLLVHVVVLPAATTSTTAP